jgi:hypothetical protein
MKKNFPCGKILVTLTTFLGLSLAAFAQTLNPSSISTNGNVNVIVQDSTTIYMGGSFSGAGYKASGIAKVNSNARIDISFPSLGGTCYSSVPDGSGGWYVGGSFSVQGLSNLVHILANKTIDISFAPNPNSVVNALHLDGSTLYVGGSFTQISGQTKNRLASCKLGILPQMAQFIRSLKLQIRCMWVVALIM